MEIRHVNFAVTADVTLAIPAAASDDDLRLARFLTDELLSRCGVRVKAQPLSSVPESGRFILMGSAENPLVRDYCAKNNLELSANRPGSEGYILDSSERAVVVAGSDARGAFYGLQSLRQLIGKNSNGFEVQGALVRDWPAKSFRGVKLYLPGSGNIALLKRFIRDVMVLYKFNTLMMEMNACMRLDRHPELNEGWIEFARDTNYSRRNYPPGPLHGREQNSSHQDCGDSSFIEKADVAALADWCREHYIELVPEIPSLTHSFYLLSKHKELSEVPGDKWPDTYCPSNPGSYKLLFEVMDEYIEVTRPRMVHAGHDEWFAPFGLCPCCSGKDPGELYGNDLRKIHDYLAGNNLSMAIWGDYLLEAVRGKGLKRHVAPDGWVYHSPGAMTPQQVEQLVPKDILIFNWFWSKREHGESDEAQLDEFGFRQIYGNMEPDIPNYVERSKRKTILGGAPSIWEATTEFNVGKDMIYTILGCSNVLWSDGVTAPAQLSSITQASIPEVRLNLSGDTPPSQTDGPAQPVEISSSFNAPLADPALKLDLSGMRTGRLRAGNLIFDLANGSGAKAMIAAGSQGTTPAMAPREVSGIKIGRDVTSLIFLHACALPATNKEAYRLIWDFDDSADLLGWYEITFDDGLPERIPIRYGVNILEWNWRQSPKRGAYCYGADEIACGTDSSHPISFFAYEWMNPRLGKVIQEVRLQGSSRFRGAVPGFENAFGKVIPSNAVMLKAISFVNPRAKAEVS